MEQTLRNTGAVTSYCPQCGAISNFEHRHSVDTGETEFSGGSGGSTRHVRFGLHQCTGCRRGGLSKYSSAANGAWTGAHLKYFFPFQVLSLPLPKGVPVEIEKEFREAESCSSFGAKRAAAALFRSALEKTLKLNGYIKQGNQLRDLQSKIDEAAKDGVITEARKKKAHDDIRTLGNDVLHDDWREVTKEEVDAAHHYTQRIIEDFYDNRPEVEIVLKAKGRITP
jgi:hypothetical protein